MMMHNVVSHAFFFFKYIMYLHSYSYIHACIVCAEISAAWTDVRLSNEVYKHLVVWLS